MKIPCKKCGIDFETDGHEIRCGVCRVEQLKKIFKSEENKKETLTQIKRHLKGLNKAVEKLEKE